MTGRQIGSLRRLGEISPGEIDRGATLAFVSTKSGRQHERRIMRTRSRTISPTGHCGFSGQCLNGEYIINIFFDTEFTGLSSEPLLLSIGLVADDGQTLYIEFTNGWSEADCSYWVREHVMPMLGKGERLTRRDAVSRIIAWLALFELPTTLLGETTWDTDLLADLMLEFSITRDHFNLEVLALSSKEQAKTFETAKQKYLESRQLTPHHALSDALAFHSAWHSVVEFSSRPENN